jgi:histidinol phosphatase-like PHP family hydrolase
MGVTFGIAEEHESPDFRANDSFISGCISMARKYGLYIGLQVLRPGWQKYYSKNIIDSIDFILMDALRFPDKDGKIKGIWIEPPVLTDVEDFMERYVAFNIKVLSDHINIWGNPTFLPVSLQGRYDELWTEKRMKAVIDAAVKNNVAIEINSRYRIPEQKFIIAAKAAGARFTFGSNEHDTNIGNIEWSINMAKECGLEAKDFFTPKRRLRID